MHAVFHTTRLCELLFPIPIATVDAWLKSEDGYGVGTPYMLLDWIEGRTLEWNASLRWAKQPYGLVLAPKILSVRVRLLEMQKEWMGR